MTTRGGSPVAKLRWLRSELRRARERAGRTQKDVAAEFGWHPSKVIRIEQGSVTLDVADLSVMLRYYGVTDQDKISEFTEAARSAKEHVWWDDYRRDFSPELITFVSYEASAVRNRQFQLTMIPGILQTEQYARAIMRLYDDDDRIIDRGVALRLDRQRILEAPDPPQMFFVLDEAAIRRPVGGRDVMAGQLRKLKELADRPNVSIQVVPLAAGEYVGMKGSFTIFEFAGADQDFVVFPEQTLGIVTAKTPEEISQYVATFFELEDVARPAADFGQIVDTVLAES
ncbi:helix-turn-helix domain-containing protein [Actinocrispum wychmicini]|uniref:Helix-turn-helix protein n=1 Tax=Actinocrispum wychmicini TaxID=1213861 RepID=A0A4R2J7P2_9PSEU|nr:helix-turn-helix transcriptional regulator [Actinocrispum wychmicini]TCO55161.1 helix-turn-helix protein [Actinocrispum wychmicini]